MSTEIGNSVEINFWYPYILYMKWMQTHPVLTFVVVAIVTSLFCLSVQRAVTYAKVNGNKGSQAAYDIDDIVPSAYDAGNRSYTEANQAPGPGYLIRSVADTTLENTAKMQPTGERPSVPELLYTKSTHTRL